MTLFDVYPLFDLEIVSGKGAYVLDQQGRRYLDFYGGHAVISIGHSHPHYVGAVQAQLDKIGFYSNSVRISVQEALASKLGELSGYPDYSLFLVNSGAEAVENALKLASFRNGRSKVLSMERAFHGRTAAAIHVTQDERITAPINRGFERIFLPWNDPDAAVDAIAKEDACAFIIEGIQGIGGIYVPDPGYLQAVEAACRRHGVVLILDEIQSGYGRTGRFFAHQHAGIRPDLMTIAKGMGNGFPVGGVLIHPDFKARHGLLGTTFGGNHLAGVAALAVLEVLEQEQLIAHAAQMGAALSQPLKRLEGVREVRGLGLMVGVELPFPVGPFRQRLLKSYNIFTGSAANPNTIRLLPPLNITRQETDHFLQSFSACLHETMALA